MLPDRRGNVITWGAFREGAGERPPPASGCSPNPGFAFGYLATVRPDGGPHIHPVMPVIAGDHLEVVVVPSPKLEDLPRPRGAAHGVAMWAHYNQPPSWPATYEVWSANR